MQISEAFALYREAEIVAAGLSAKTYESYIYIAEMMGHTSIETTRVYLRFENPKLREIHQNCFI